MWSLPWPEQRLGPLPAHPPREDLSASEEVGATPLILTLPQRNQTVLRLSFKKAFLSLIFPLLLVYCCCCCRTKGGHSSKRHHRSSRVQAHHRSPSPSPGRHSHTSGRKKEDSRSKANPRHRSSSLSSRRSSSRSASRERGASKGSKSPHDRQNHSR